MSTVMTHSTTHDLQPYYMMLKEYPRLSDAETAALVASVTALEMHARTERAMRIRQQLIEGHLGIALHHARACCPPVFYCSHFSDLLAAANLALVEAIDCFDWEKKGNLTTYLYVCIKWAARQAFADNCQIRITQWARTQAGKARALQELDRLQPLSLDCILSAQSECYEWYPLFSTSGGVDGKQQEEKRARLNTLLSYLSPRAQDILRLRYGLYYQDDERPRSLEEIASHLRISDKVVSGTITDALRRLQAFACGQATLIKRTSTNWGSEGFCISLSNRSSRDSRRVHKEAQYTTR